MAALQDSRTDLLNIQQLRTLCAVVDHGSYAGAARAMGLSTPSLWARVRALEVCYGATLFRRQGRGVVATAEALRLSDAVRPLLAGLDSSFALVGSASRLRPRVITLVTGMRAAQEELGPAVAGFCQHHPEVTLRWLHTNNQLAQEMLVEGRADLAVMLEPLATQVHPRVALAPAYDVEYLVVTPRGHPLLKTPTLRWERLVQYPLITGHEGTFVRGALDQALQRRGLLEACRIRVETDNSATTIAVVRSGMGVGIIAGRPTGPLLAGLGQRSLRHTLGAARAVIAWKRGVILPDVVGELRQSILLA